MVDSINSVSYRSYINYKQAKLKRGLLASNHYLFCPFLAEGHVCINHDLTLWIGKQDLYAASGETANNLQNGSHLLKVDFTFAFLHEQLIPGHQIRMKPHWEILLATDTSTLFWLLIQTLS